MPDTKEIVVDQKVSHRQYDCHNDADGETQRETVRDMTVFFPYGTVIAKRTAVYTLVKVVQEIGVTKVPQVVEEYNLKCCKV